MAQEPKYSLAWSNPLSETLQQEYDVFRWNLLTQNGDYFFGEFTLST